MIKTIQDALKRNHIEKYRINELKTSSVELFFVKKNLDMRRITNQREYTVTVFRDFVLDESPMLGQSSAVIREGMSEETMDKVLRDAYYAASFVKNPAYELPEAVRSETIEIESGIAQVGLAQAAEQMAKAAFTADQGHTSFINSLEIFVTETQMHIVSSAGTDAAYRKCGVEGEFVVQCKEPQDVEQHNQFAYTTLSADELSARVRTALEEVEARAKAVVSPKAGTYDVLLTGENLVTVMSYYLERSDAAYIYPRYSNFAVDESVQGSEITGEKMNIIAKPVVPFSEEGVALEDFELVKEAQLKKIHGSVRYSRYLKVPPTGLGEDYCYIINNGTTSVETLRNGKVLEPVYFSDFQMDAFSGYFSGEIRLAYLYENGKTSYLTGGSISGNIFECQKDFTFSAERYETAQYRGPLALKVKGVSVAGC